MGRCVILVVVSALILGCVKEKYEIVLGGLFPLTGNASTYGMSSMRGMQMAIEEWNAKGGVKINKNEALVKGVYGDTKGTIDTSVAVIQEMINQSDIKALVGCVLSNNSLAVAPICQETGIPMVTPGSTNPKVTEVGDYIFRTCYIDPFQGEVMAKYVFNNLGITKAAVLYDNMSDYNKGLAEVFKQKYEEYGGTIVAFVSFSDEANTYDYTGYLNKIKAAKAEFIYSPNYYVASATIIKQAAELGMKIPVGGSDGWDSPEFIEIGGKYVEGGVFSNHFSKDDPSPEVQNFVTKYRTRFGDEPDGLAALSFDAANVILTAIKNTKSIDGKILKEEIVNINMQGVTGEIRYNEKRNPIKPVVILQIQNGRQAFLTRINPN